MRNSLKITIIILTIAMIGLYSRAMIFHKYHPDKDELFELQSLQTKKIADTLKKDQFYGDHTSFPGEFILHYPFLKFLGFLDNPIHIDVAKGNVGTNKKSFWIIAIPKITLTALSFYLFYLLCRPMKELGGIIAFIIFSLNSHLIYGAFSLRPYGMLPELAIFNIYMCNQLFTRKDPAFYLAHSALIFFTCIYHAYGPLISFMPIILFIVNNRNNKVPVYLFIFLPLSLIAWAYYASYNSFGLTPNAIQSQVDTFQFIKKEDIFNGILGALFSGSFIMITTLPFVLAGILNIKRDTFLNLFILVIFPILLICLMDVKTNYWIHPRQFTWVIPAMALWCGTIAESRKETNRQNQL
jgi:hypothetical protein